MNALPEGLFAKDSRFWLLVVGAAALWLCAALTRHINEPWTGEVDFNGAVWSQGAHNSLRAGIGTTLGIPAAFYFGPLPIPREEYYTHHPMLLPLLVTGLFALFGQHEGTARLVPVMCSTVSLFLLFLLVRRFAGNRAAALSGVVFATLPMELRYGLMVNFEPCELMLIIGLLLCLRLWSENGQLCWLRMTQLLAALLMCMAWVGYIYVGILCAFLLITPGNGNRALARSFLWIALACGTLFLLHAKAVNTDLAQDLWNAFAYRLGAGSRNTFTLAEWSRTVGSRLLLDIPLPAWLVASAGAAVQARKSERWLLDAMTIVFVMDVLYLVVFRNASFIHGYAAFYFVAPVAVGAGVAFDALARHLEARQWAGGLALASAVALGIWMESANGRRDDRFHVLGSDVRESQKLIPALGSAAREHFPEGATILCNFFDQYGPQLPYYAQRKMLGGMDEAAFWTVAPGTPTGGIVWMEAKEAQQIIARLPPSELGAPVQIAGHPFRLWR